MIATGNAHKIAEIEAVFAPLGVAVVGLTDVAGEGGGGRGIPEPVEDGETFEANARLKATYYAERLGRMCLADDSGLEVDALGGEPGVYSARYAELAGGTPITARNERDRANNALLLSRLEGVERRTARFVCAMCLARPIETSRGGGKVDQPQRLEATASASSQVLAIVRGTFEGRIGLPGQVPRGSNGFGYDPLFLASPEFAHTCAELSSQQKNARSHRGNAARLMAQRIAELLETHEI